VPSDRKLLLLASSRGGVSLDLLALQPWWSRFRRTRRVLGDAALDVCKTAMATRTRTYVAEPGADKGPAWATPR
jgi:hypothetical protein